MAKTADDAAGAGSTTPGGASRAADSTDTTGADGNGIASARERFGRLSSDVQERYQRLSDDVRRGAERASSEMRRGAERARERYAEASVGLRENYARARAEADDVTRQVSAYVRENPGKSILMAAGVGFLLGLLFRGRDEEETE